MVPQALLESAGLPFVGTGAAAARVAFDKVSVLRYCLDFVLLRLSFVSLTSHFQVLMIRSADCKFVVV